MRRARRARRVRRATQVIKERRVRRANRVPKGIRATRVRREIRVTRARRETRVTRAKWVSVESVDTRAILAKRDVSDLKASLAPKAVLVRRVSRVITELTV